MSQCTSGFISEEELRTVLIGQRNRAQGIIPSLRFDCDGAITKWIVGAFWRNAANATSFPDLQIWRNSSENGVYMKVGNTTLFATRSNSSRLYEFPVEPSLPFQRGDILGIFQPSNSLSRLRIYYRIGSGNPLNFVFRPPASVTEPPLETFNTSISGIIRQTVLPLVTMEICKPCIKTYNFGVWIQEHQLSTLCGQSCSWWLCQHALLFFLFLYLQPEVCQLSLSCFPQLASSCLQQAQLPFNFPLH